ncbi:MAG TPA: Fe-S cluster assembly protein SufD [Cyclobacteriaceae bacterium]|nr:Fe-S cluster assembly protein SufD [Cyclobacteriaceae bacterium]
MSTITDKENFSTTLIDSLLSLHHSNDKDARSVAQEELKKWGLPTAKSEEYKFTPITRILAKNFSAEELLVEPSASKIKIEDTLLSEFPENVVVFSNGRFDESQSSLKSMKGLTIIPLKQAIEQKSEVIEAHFKSFPRSKDPFGLLNAACWQDGLFVHVEKNIAVSSPLVVINQHDAGTAKVSSHSRLLVLIEQGADFSVIEKTVTTGNQPVFHSLNEEIKVLANASFKYYKIQNDPGDLIQVSNTTIYQENSSRTDTYTFSLDGKLIRNNLSILIDGEGCESHFFGLYLTKGETLVDNHTVVDHMKPNSFSNELYKGLMDEKSKGVFNGKIYVRPHAQKTNAFQSNRNILLSDTATINTKPQLEIWADDVKCSHGCTTGQLDEEALFYLQSRGIPKSTAKAMLLYAFAGEVLEAIKDERLREYIDGMISERLHKNF